MQFIPLIIPAHIREIEDDAQCVECRPAPKGSMVAEMLGKGTARKHADTHAQIPRGEQCGVGSTALAVGSHVYEHHLEGRPQMPVAQADDERCEVISDGIVYGCEDDEAAD